MSSLVRLSARRFEQSPYFDCYASPESVLGVAAGRYYESANGQDPLETYWKLRKEAVVMPLPAPPMAAHLWTAFCSRWQKTVSGMWLDDWGMEMSETVAVTQSGAECLTRFPRNVQVID